MLCSVYCLLATNLLGQLTGPIFKGQARQWWLRIPILRCIKSQRFADVCCASTLAIPIFPVNRLVSLKQVGCGNLPYE